MAVHTDQAREVAERAARVFPGALNMRHYKVAAPEGQIFVERADGPYLYDVAGNRYLDMWLSHTALLVGHNHPAVKAAIEAQLENGTNFGLGFELQVRFGERLQERFTSLEKLCITDSNTRANTYAVRLARAFTGRPVLAKMQGSYHGTVDTLWFGMQKGWGEKVGDKVTLAGVAPHAADDIALMQWNDIPRCDAVFAEYGDRLAAVIIEPVVGDGMLPPAPGFLEYLQAACRKNGTLLIYDESITGGMGRGGAQEAYGVYPDLTVLGKSIGGGFPIAVVGGRGDVMSLMDASKGLPPVPTGQTFPGHPLACAAGLAELDLLGPREYAHMAGLVKLLGKGVAQIAREFGVPLSMTSASHLFELHWTTGTVVTWEDHVACDERPLTFIRNHMFRRGIYYGGSRGCFSIMHTEEHVGELLAALRSGLEELSAGRGA